jgi:hypothetical protein
MLRIFPASNPSLRPLQTRFVEPKPVASGVSRRTVARGGPKLAKKTRIRHIGLPYPGVTVLKGIPLIGLLPSHQRWAARTSLGPGTLVS